MADSIHDQWPTATDEWPRVAAQFLAAWVSIFADYDVNSVDAAFAAGIGYLALLLQDSTVMAGDMITHLAQSSVDFGRGTVANFNNLQSNVLPAWGVLAARYANSQIFAAVSAEESARETAIAAEAAQRALDINATRQLATLQVSQEAAQRVLGDVQVQQQVIALINQEAALRAAGDAQLQQQFTAALTQLAAQLADQIKTVLTYAQSIPGLIDTRAAAGYDPTLRARGNVVQRILDTVVAHDPAVSSLVSKLAGFIIDLVEVDDPLIRVAAQLVLKQLIDHLGLSGALHAMLGDLLGVILGGGQPKTLQDVIADIGNRLDALESVTAELSPLSDEADQLHELGSLVFDAALLGYITATVADPVAAANDTATVIDGITGPLLAPLRALLGM